VLLALMGGCGEGPAEEGASLAAPLTCSPTTYEAEAVTKSTGGESPPGWNIWTNGYVATQHAFGSGKTTVTVRAAGSKAAGVWPNMVVSIGGQVIGSAVVSSESYSEYTFSATTTEGTREIRIEFTNDYYQNGEDRNLFVDKFTITCEGGSGGAGGNGGTSGNGGAGNGGTSNGGTGNGGAGNGGTGNGGTSGSGTIPGSATLSFQTDWGSGYCANVDVKNDGTATSTSWLARLDLKQSTISNVWNAKLSGSAGVVNAEPMDYNAKIPASQTTSFGFCANATGPNYKPSLLGVTIYGASGGSGGSGGQGGTAGSSGQGGTAGQGGAGQGGASGEGGTAGSAGQGGTTGEGGAAGEGGTSGEGGDGGTAGEGGTSGEGGASGGQAGTENGGSGGEGGAGDDSGDYEPPTGGYVIQSPVLADPELAIEHALSTADFYENARDAVGGGFYTYLNRQGQPTSTNKSFVVQSRNAYAFVRAFMLSGDEHYLDLARHALTFLYDHGWDPTYGGFYFQGDRFGNKVSDPSGSQSPKWSFVQHYALVGVNAMCEATRSSLDCGWLDTGIASLDQRLWDFRPGFIGYYNNASLDFTSRWGKGFTPTIDGITTHALHDYLLTNAAPRRARLLDLADAASDRFVPNMTAPGVKFGFPEEYDSNWNIDTGQRFGFVGHIYKTAWCLARAYQVDQRAKYRDGARQILLQMYEKGGFDKVNGAPNYSFYYDSGVASTDKEYWQLEQAILSGLYGHEIAATDAERAVFLEMADRSTLFYFTHLPDTVYGGIFFQTNASGSVVRTDKGDQWEGAYHDVELAYHLYVDGNLRFWRRPVTLYYRFEAAPNPRSFPLSPVPFPEGRLAISEVWHEGAPYEDFSPGTRELHLPAGVSGVFAVTFEYVPEP
jgi:mannose/cellobiose epimerase-like protein (N-acyl-D-glucosamine 2-epimerase family)